MCGRYGFAQGEFREIKLRFNIGGDIPLFKPRYNIAPSQQAPVIANLEGANRLELFQWGLVPSWAKDSSIGNRMINARAETLAEKPSFKRLLKNRRCLVLADGFYEWRKEGKGKIPMWFRLRSGEPFVIAGLWDTWKKPDGSILDSFSIITLPPNDFMRPIHDRIPAILHPDDEETWLNCTGTPFDKAEPLLVPFPSDEMAAHVTTTRVNNSRYNEPDCGAPV